MIFWYFTLFSSELLYVYTRWFFTSAESVFLCNSVDWSGGQSVEIELVGGHDVLLTSVTHRPGFYKIIQQLHYFLAMYLVDTYWSNKSKTKPNMVQYKHSLLCYVIALILQCFECVSTNLHYSETAREKCAVCVLINGFSC